MASACSITNQIGPSRQSCRPDIPRAHPSSCRNSQGNRDTCGQRRSKARLSTMQRPSSLVSNRSPLARGDRRHSNRGAAALPQPPLITSMSCRRGSSHFPDALEGAVMIGGIPIIAAVAGDDAARAAMTQTRCGYRVFAVVIARLGGSKPSRLPNECHPCGTGKARHLDQTQRLRASGGRFSTGSRRWRLNRCRPECLPEQSGQSPARKPAEHARRRH
jgi:hypothetical protein